VRRGRAECRTRLVGFWSDRAMAIDLLATVGEPERSRVLSACRSTTYRKGQIVFHEGDPGDGLHLVERGHLLVRTSTESGDTVTLDVAGPGDVLGEVALLLPDPRRSATVVALSPATTRVLTVAAFETLRAEHPGVATAVSQLLAERVARLTRRLTEALYVSVDERVARRIAAVAVTFGGSASGTEVPLTQQDLADLVGATRPTVNQALKRLEAQGAISLYRGGIRLLDIEALDAATGQ
jgi:CRP-like cAMP-binding protein